MFLIAVQMEADSLMICESYSGYEGIGKYFYKDPEACAS